MMNFAKHSYLIVWMTRSHLPFKLGLAFGRGLVRIPWCFSLAVNSYRRGISSAGYRSTAGGQLWIRNSPEIRWFSRLAVEQLDMHRNLPEVNPLLPYANSKHAIPVKSDVYGAGILKAEELHDS
jgi:hypothetical protein